MTEDEVQKIDHCADLLPDPGPEVVHQLTAEILRLRRWIDDCQSHMYINCVYCGHRYGPNETTPMTRAETLKQHISECPDHPMSNLVKKLTKIGDRMKEIISTEYEGSGGLSGHIVGSSMNRGRNEVANEVLEMLE